MSESPLNKDASGEEKTTADRLTAFSDAVFAVIVRIMALELKAPDQPAFSALWPLWPTALSYAVSYLFIAIIWDQRPSPYGVRRPSDIGIDLDQLRTPVYGLAPAICDGMGCTHVLDIGGNGHFGRLVQQLGPPFPARDTILNLYERDESLPDRME